MADNDPSAPPPRKPSRTTLVHLLEQGDGLAHILVGVLLLLLALGVLANSTYAFVRDLSVTAGTDNFAQTALNYLSSVLLGVIILELLSTILTYVQARRLDATIKDFLVVGLISSVRKILLIGAQSSITKSNADDFVKESIGTVVSIVGILLLIAGLLLLEYRRKSASVDKAKPDADAD